MPRSSQNKIVKSISFYKSDGTPIKEIDSAESFIKYVNEKSFEKISAYNNAIELVETNVKLSSLNKNTYYKIYKNTTFTNDTENELNLCSYGCYDCFYFTNSNNDQLISLIHEDFNNIIYKDTSINIEVSDDELVFKIF